jgi:glycosyltransferase involved in cell wall biosynthesis
VTTAGEAGARPKVSIIVPVFNRAFMIRDVMCSVAAQTYPNVELIIVDDGSTDISPQLEAFIASASVGANPVKFIRIAHAGVSRARNVGIRRAEGDFVSFLDSDDLLFPNAISDLVACLESSSEQFSLGRIVETDYALSGPLVDADPLEATDILRRAAWMTHASLYRREAVLAVGGFDEALRVGEDSIFQLHILATHGEGVACPQYIGVRRRHEFGHLSLSPDLAVEHARMLESLCSSICDNKVVASSSRASRAMLLLAILYSIRKRSDLETQPGLLRKYRDTSRCVLPDSPAVRRLFNLLASDLGTVGRLGSLGLLSAGRALRRGLALASRQSQQRELTETRLLNQIRDMAERLERAGQQALG